MPGVTVEHFILQRAVSDGFAQRSSFAPLQHSVLSQVGFTSGAGQDESGDFVAASDQSLCGEQGYNGAVAVGDKPERWRVGVMERWSNGALEWWSHG